MIERPALGWPAWFLVLALSASAQASSFVTPSLGWSRTARLPRSRAEAEQLAKTAREPMPFPPGAMNLRRSEGRAVTARYVKWLHHVTDAAAQASAWYLTDSTGPEPFRERRRVAFPEELPLPNLGPATAAYVILSETNKFTWDSLDKALGPPRAGVTAEQYIATLALVGFLYEDIGRSVAALSSPGVSHEVAAAYELTRPITKTLLRKCRRASTSLQTWTTVSRSCEEWLGKHWKTELTLASLDELLPVADRADLPRHGFAPMVLSADRRQ